MNESIEKFRTQVSKDEIELIVMGASAGGIDFLKNMLLSLPSNFQLPIVVVQHFSGDFEESLAEFFSHFTALTVKEVEDKEVIQKGVIYFAPADYHVLISKEKRLHLSVDEPVYFCRPSIDVLFQTAAEAYRDHLLAFVLTGANEDGALGLQYVKELGGKVGIQDAKDAEFSFMPLAALRKVPQPDFIGNRAEIAELISGF